MDRNITITWAANVQSKDDTISGLGLVWYDGSEGTRHQIASNKWEALAPNAEIVNFRGDVICCFNHDFSRVLGRQSNNTLQLQNNDKGISYSVKLNPADPDHQSVKAKVDRGDVYGSSATFRPLTHKWSDDTLLYDKIELVEIGCVVNAAMTSSTAFSDANNAYSLAVYETAKRLEQLKW